MSFESTASSSCKPTSTQTPVRPPRTPGPINDIKNTFDRAEALSARVHRLVNELVGSVPEAGGVGGPEDDFTDGLFDELAKRARRVEQQLSTAESALDRLDKVLVL